MKSMPFPSQAERRHQDARGFTLIELMIAVAIVGILAAIALPAYNSYILKSRRVDAKNAVLDMASREEKFFSINNRYSTTAADLGYARLPTDVNSSGAVYYQLQVLPNPDSSGFIARAVPVGSQTADKVCYAYQVDQTGSQSNVDVGNQKVAGPGCW